MKVNVDQGLKSFGIVKKMCLEYSHSYARGVVWKRSLINVDIRSSNLRYEEVNVGETRSLRGISAVTRINRIRNKDLRCNTSVRENTSDKVI